MPARTQNFAPSPRVTQPALPTRQESEQAMASGHVLKGILRDGKNLVFVKEKTQATVPPRATQMFLSILNQMAQGNLVAVVPSRKELSAKQAADILCVSRPFLIQLLKDGKIPYRMVGTHYRLNYDDVAAYDRKDRLEREKILDKLVAEAQELNMGY